MMRKANLLGLLAAKYAMAALGVLYVYAYFPIGLIKAIYEGF